MKRRDLLIAGTALCGVIALPALRGLRQPALEFEPIPGMPPFRRLPSGVVSGAPVALAGIDPVPAAARNLRDRVAADPCGALFGAEGWPDDAVPVVVFTDYNCPYCPTLSELVIGLQEDGAPIRVIWKDLPVLGPRSVAAARVALAAGQQGAYLPVHRHLMRIVLRPGPAALAALADQFGLDADRLAADAASDEVSTALEHAAALAAILAVVGTPAALVGRTLVTGAIDRATMQRLIALEQSEPRPDCGG